MEAQDRYDSLIKYYAEIYNVDWQLIKAQIKAESNFVPDAKSWCNAKGLSQFMEKTWEEWADGTPGIQKINLPSTVLLDPRDPEDAIKAQCAFMAYLLKNFKNNVLLSLAAYNWGMGKINNLLKTIKPEQIITHLPKETSDYVARITKFFNEYKRGL